MIAFDTNVLIYAEDPNDPGGRHATAVSILSCLGFEQAIVPVQVLGEFVNVCRKKAISLPELTAEKVAAFSIVFQSPQTEGPDVQAAALH